MHLRLDGFQRFMSLYSKFRNTLARIIATSRSLFRVEAEGVVLERCHPPTLFLGSLKKAGELMGIDILLLDVQVLMKKEITDPKSLDTGLDY
ncbi:hypothetical protein Bca4012_082631 [Brassica carinata]